MPGWQGHQCPKVFRQRHDAHNKRPPNTNSGPLPPLFSAVGTGHYNPRGTTYLTNFLMQKRICYANISPLEVFLEELLKRWNFRVGALCTDLAWAAVVAAASSKLKTDETDERGREVRRHRHFSSLCSCSRSKRPMYSLVSEPVQGVQKQAGWQKVPPPSGAASRK